MAKVPGFTSQALQFLNATLQELAQDYDFNIIRKTHTFNLSTTASGNGYAASSGPNAMPSDFVRLHREGSFYTIVRPAQSLRELLAHPDAYEEVSFDDVRQAPPGFDKLMPAW